MSYNYNIWYETYDPIFSEISKKSRLPDKWISFQNISSEIYSKSIIKPINKYVEVLYPRPELIEIKDNVVRLRQKNHAEFFLLDKHSGFYNLDRPWMRQYYNTSYNPETPDNCFPKTYKFYVPWYIDLDADIFYLNPDSDSPFFIFENSSIHKKVDNTIKFLEPDFVAFNFKNTGSHMINDKFGKIMRGQPMFDMVFTADDIMVETIKEFYESN
jgi:hypothetical protein